MGAELNVVHQVDLTGATLHRIALERIYQSLPLAVLLNDAATDRSVFSQHLHAQLWYLSQHPKLAEAFQQLLGATPPPPLV